MSRFEPFNRLKVCRYGQMLFNKNDTRIGRSLDMYGEYSEGEVELFRQVLQSGNVVIEVGASVGAHTLFIAQQVGPSGVVIAFEPLRIPFQTLCANLALNSITNVYALQQAIGAQPGSTVIPAIDYTSENDFGSFSLGKYENGEGVPISTLDGFNFPACSFLKIDVEGMELDVLQGAERLLRQHRPVIYLENDRPDRADALIRHLNALGYKMYWHRPPYYNPQNFLGNPQNAFPNEVSNNMVCIHSALPHQLTGLEPVEVPAG